MVRRTDPKVTAARRPTAARHHQIPLYLSWGKSRRMDYSDAVLPAGAFDRLFLRPRNQPMAQSDEAGLDPSGTAAVRLVAASHRCSVGLGSPYRRQSGALALMSLDRRARSAFSSDVIPLHLLTEEAIRLYPDKLAPGGMIIFHLSNCYFNLAPIVASTARDLGLVSLMRASPAGTIEGTTLPYYASIVAVLARKPEDFGALADM